MKSVGNTSPILRVISEHDCAIVRGAVRSPHVENLGTKALCRKMQGFLRPEQPAN